MNSVVYPLNDSDVYAQIDLKFTTKYIATHFDERMRIAEDEHDKNGKFFHLMLEYYDYNMTQTPSKCYAVYDGEAHQMGVYVSGNPSIKPWKAGAFSNKDYHVMFDSNFYPPEVDKCQPYSFICKTSRNNFFRLPEDRAYFFGTDWHDWAWSDYDAHYGLSCEEQHYYNTGNKWIANSGPKLDGGYLTESEIWYYAEHGGSCQGCGKISGLQCLEDCIYAGTIGTNQCKCSSYDATNSPTSAPSSAPSSAPTSPRSPSPRPPSPRPSPSPSLSPSLSPSSAPSVHPTDSDGNTNYVDGETCDSVKDYVHDLGIQHYNYNRKLDQYLEAAESAFIDDNPDCGATSTGQLEYFYYFTLGDWTDQKETRAPLSATLHMCCGPPMSATFGASYEGLDRMTDYTAGPVWEDRYGDNTMEHVDWSDPSTYTWVQYVVLSLASIGILAICVAVCGLFWWWSKKKKGTHSFGDISDSPKVSPKNRKRRESNSEIATPLAATEGDEYADGIDVGVTTTAPKKGKRRFMGLGSPKELEVVPSASLDPYNENEMTEMNSEFRVGTSVASPEIEVQVSASDYARRPPPVPKNAQNAYTGISHTHQ